MDRIINSFVYDVVKSEKMPYPTIPPWLDETYSQAYEDIIILSSIIAHIVSNKIRETSISYIEIGANHPVCTSPSYLISRKFNVGGILVEPNPKLAKILRQYRPLDTVVEAAVYCGEEKEIEFFISPENEVSSINKDFVENWKEATLGIEETIKVKTIKVNELLNMVVNVAYLILSIDVEGHDLSILQDVDYNVHRPFIIQIEPSEHYSPGTTEKMIDFMKEKNYRLISMNYVNLIFQDNTRG